AIAARQRGERADRLQMGYRVAKAFTRAAQARAQVFRQAVFKLLDARLRTIDFWLRVLLVQTLGDTLLARHRTLKLIIQREIHSLTQTLQHGLLACQTQLRMLLLQAVMNLSKAAGTVGKEIIHRHLQTLLSVLNLAQQLQLIATHHFRSSGWRRGA